MACNCELQETERTYKGKVWATRSEFSKKLGLSEVSSQQ